MEHRTLKPGFDGWPEKMERRTERGRRISHLGLFGSDVIIDTDRTNDVNVKPNADARTYLQCSELFWKYRK
jgi:hypothetical protein